MNEAKKTYVLKLYVAGKTPNSMRALKTLKNILEEEFQGVYALKVIDVLKNPQLAEEDKILATPTLSKILPPPVRKIIGDLTDRERVLIGLENHLQIIKSEISHFKPARIAIDSLSAMARGVSNNAFRQFVIGVTGYAKQEEITGFFTNTTDQFLGFNSITDSHISTITDTILILQYVEIHGEMSRAINVFKMRGSWHDKGIREYNITADGPDIKDSFRNYERIISGAPSRVNVDEKAELSQIVKRFEDKPNSDI